MSERVSIRRPPGQLCRAGVRLLLCALLGAALSASVVARQKGAGVRPAANSRGERRVALVIGNSNYESEVGRLKNPANDASDVAAALQSLGFEVVGGKAQLDVSLRQMDGLVRDFGREIRRGGVGVFYFSGHGIQVNRLNYLLPLGSRIEKEQDVPFEAFNVERVLAEMEAAENRLNILILDACRNNPLTRGFRSAGAGLARPENVPIGTYVAFAARDGQAASDNAAGRNGLYTQELLKNLVRPGLRLEDIFINTRREVRRLSNNAQVPVEYGSIDAPFFFVEGGGAAGLENASDLPVSNGKPPSPSSYGNASPAPTSHSMTAEDYRIRAGEYLKNGEYDRAIANYTRSIELDPNHAWAYISRGSAYSNRGEYDRAIADFTKAVELNPKNATAYYNRGNAHRNKRAFDRAIADYTRAIELDPKHLWAYNNRGSIYTAKREYERALADLTKAIELDPKYVTGYKNRAVVYKAKGDDARAAADRRKAAELEGQVP